MMICPLCRGALTCPALGQVIECPHCHGQIEMPFAPPELEVDPPQTRGWSRWLLWVVGGMLVLIAAAGGVVWSGVLGSFFRGAAADSSAIQQETPSASHAEKALGDSVAKESEGR